MGCGSWTRDSYVSYSTTRGMSVSTDGMISGSYSNQDMFKAKTIDSALNPKNVIRECCDTEEHPIPYFEYYDGVDVHRYYFDESEQMMADIRNFLNN